MSRTQRAVLSIRSEDSGLLMIMTSSCLSKRLRIPLLLRTDASCDSMVGSTGEYLILYLISDQSALGGWTCSIYKSAVYILARDACNIVERFIQPSYLISYPAKQPSVAGVTVTLISSHRWRDNGKVHICSMQRWLRDKRHAYSQCLEFYRDGL